MGRLKRSILIILGSLCFVLGVIGIFLPVLPTTPFLLLAAGLYARSSNRFYVWLLNNRWFGSYIRNYREGKGIPRKQKIFSIAMLWLTIGYTIGFVIDLWWVRILLLIVAVGVTFHLAWIKTFRGDEETDKSSEMDPDSEET